MRTLLFAMNMLLGQRWPLPETPDRLKAGAANSLPQRERKLVPRPRKTYAAKASIPDGAACCCRIEECRLATPLAFDPVFARH
jgi:hypothetical protein